MKTRALIALVGILSGIAGEAYAGGCGYVARKAYVAPTYVAPAKFETVIRISTYDPYIAAAYPISFTTYQPQAVVPAVALAPVAPVADPCAKHLEKFERRLQLLETENKALKERAAPAPQSRGDAPPRGSMLAAKCASCHTEGKLHEKTGFAMFGVDGKLAALSAVQKDLCMRQVTSGKMPLAGKLTEEEGNGILGELIELKPSDAR